MRTKLTLALAAVLVVALAGVALAVQSQTADIKLSKSKAGSPTAVDAHFIIKDPGNTAAGQVGKPTVQVKRVDIGFPKTMTFNTDAFPQCTQTIANAIIRQCGKAKIATGVSVVDGRAGALQNATNPSGIYNAKIQAYNRKRGLALVVTARGLPDTVLLPSFTRTNTLQTQLPSILTQVSAFLSDFRLTIPIKKGKRGKYFAVLPKKCPKGGKFVIKTTFFLVNGQKSTTKGTVNRCRK
jgi:hypothetical protein